MAQKSSGSVTDTVVKVMLVFFISILSFSVGVFTGKQVSDSDYRKMALDGEYQKSARDVASTANTEKADDGKKADAQAGISDKEVESLTQEFVAKEKADADTAAMTADSTAAPAADAAKTVAQTDDAKADGYKDFSHTKTAEADKKVAPKTADAMDKVSEKVAKGEPATDGKMKKRAPSSVLPSVASSAVGKYTVQVASFATEKDARTHAAHLKAKGWNAFYIPATIKGKTWYRVSVGLFTTSKSAMHFRAQLLKESHLKAAIIQKIVE